MANSCNPAGCIIDDSLANARITLFSGRKKGVLDGILGDKPEIPSIDYSVKGFQALLDYVAEPTYQYDGFRAYFASYPASADDPGGDDMPAGHERNIFLVYVPTRTVGQDHQDDLYNCIVISGNRVIVIDQATALSVIGNYQAKFKVLEKDGVDVTGNQYFKETRATWYDVKTLRDDGSTPGLISYIKCMKDPANTDGNPIDKIVMQLGCFVEDEAFPEAYYQLTPLFQLHQPNHAVQTLFLGSITADYRQTLGRRAGNTTLIVLDDGGTADTGLPCPPRICSGGLLNP